MKERPILMSAEMIRAIIDGRKSQTRRVVKLTPKQEETIDKQSREDYRRLPAVLKFCPYGLPGDRLYVREEWATPAFWDSHPPRDIPPHEVPVVYHADGAGAAPHFNVGKWRRSIHMPRWASRIILEVKRVRVERLQEITEEDARAEGCYEEGGGVPSAKRQFQGVWNSINEKRGFGWEFSPWVWVVEFERVEA